MPNKKHNANTNNDLELITLQEKIAELENKLKRSMADYINLKNRTEQDKGNIIEFANLVLIKNLLPIVDNLLLASKHTEDVGVKMIYDQFSELLKSEGVTKIDALNKEFDANTMEAVEKEGTKETDSKAIVSSIIKDGYVYGGKVIRPAQVTVSYS